MPLLLKTLSHLNLSSLRSGMFDERAEEETKKVFIKYFCGNIVGIKLAYILAVLREAEYVPYLSSVLRNMSYK